MQGFIEIAISVFLLFLLVSIIVTAANEIISRLLRLRGALLFDGIKAIIDHEPLRRNFYSSGVIFSVARDDIATKPKGSDSYSVAQRLLRLTDRTGHPSYIQGRNFAKALIQALVRPEDGNAIVARFQEVEAAITKLPKGRIKDVLVATLNEGVTEVKTLEVELGKWYDTAVERLSGRYKRWQQTLAFLMGLTLAVGLNIDTLSFISRVGVDAEMRASIVDQAVQVAGSDAAAGACPEADDVTEVECYATLLSDALGDLNALPIGWTKANWQSFQAALGLDGATADVGQMALIVLGWLITAFAVTLGAPFWFDLLKTFVNIRSSGAAPKPADEGQ